MSDAQPETHVEAVLRVQHDRIESLLTAVSRGPADTRATTFEALSMLVLLHETAERRVLDPVLQELGDAGRQIVLRRRISEGRILDALTSLRQMDATSRRFLQWFLRLRVDMEDHMEAEERELFPLLRRSVDQVTMCRLGESFVVEELLVDPQGLIDSVW
jgi:hypothetical protein